jgi:hypothetical protein
MTRKTPRAPKSFRARSVIAYAIIGAAALGVLAAINTSAARAAEASHPPTGRFIEVDGVRLHYTDRGSGSPVVLLHGNAVTGTPVVSPTFCCTTILRARGHFVQPMVYPG